MADIIDQAQARSEEFLEKALASRPTPIPFSGVCLYCEEPVEQRRFCNSQCREAHENQH